ncbi:MAG: ABC transporter permease [Lachnospiraceae bacterium]
MSEMKEIFKKEMARVLKDRKMIFSVFILPVVLMIGIMTLVGNLVSGMENKIDQHTPIVYIQNQAESFQTFIEKNGVTYQTKEIVSQADRKKAEKEIRTGKADLLIEFPEKFEASITEYQEGDAVPQIKTYYNPSEDYSRAAYDKISLETLEQYRQTLLSKRVGDLKQIAIFTVNTDNKNMIIQDNDKASGKALGMMLPYFITILLFAGAMGIGTDMIAGEKERGTMASLLVSPVKRSSIVLGKVFSLMAISGISSLIYVIAMVAFMPLMTKAMTGQKAGGLNLNLSMAQIAMLAVLLIALAFLYSTIIALISVFAKTVKEASSYIMPAYMLVLVVGMMTMFSTGAIPEAAYFIPLYNSSVVLKGILSQEVSMVQYGITLAMTLGLGIVLTGVIVKAFESEKVMAG